MEYKFSKGLISYLDSLEEMKKRVDLIKSNKAEELIWFLEHEDVYTAGTSAKEEDLLEAKFPVFKVGRGGQYTYHGPGQRVVYFMLDLKKQFFPNKPDIRKFIFNLEQIIIDSLSELNIDSFRREDRIGIWVKKGISEAKIAAIGIRISSWISFHGIAINISPDLKNFDGIVPCGISNYGVTSLQKIGGNIPIEKFDKILQQNIEKFFI